jgi:hypothetical protein
LFWESPHGRATVTVRGKADYRVFIDYANGEALVSGPGIEQEFDLDDVHFPENAEACALMLVAMVEGEAE